MLARFASYVSWISVLVLAFAVKGAAQSGPAATDPSIAMEASPQQAPASPTAAKSKLPSKRDVSRIGQRGVGHGIDIYSIPKERALGQSLATKIDRTTKLITDPDVNEYVNRLAQKIGRNSDAEFLITAKIVDSDGVSIFSLPGGFIYLDSGLITALESEAELAGLIAHEIGHISARHATHALTRQYAWEALWMPMLYLGPAAFPLETLAIPLTNRKFDRDAEREADLLGMQYAYVAGYDPAAFVSALEKLNGLEARRQRAYRRIPLYKQFMRLPFRGPLSHAASRHPAMESRIRALQKEIATVLPEASQYVVDTDEFQEAQDRLNWVNRPMFRRHTDAENADKKDRPKLRDMIPLPPPEPSRRQNEAMSWQSQAGR